jgi:hypothetical protein
MEVLEGALTNEYAQGQIHQAIDEDARYMGLTIKDN